MDCSSQLVSGEFWFALFLTYRDWTRPEDRKHCSCPPSPVREFLQGERGALTEVEQEDEQRRWERDCAPGRDEEFRQEQARLEKLLREYEKRKRRRN